MSKNLADEKPAAVISSSACKHEFGFLGRQPRGTPFPDECFTCTKMIECMAVKAERPAPAPAPPPAPPQIKQEPVRLTKPEPVRVIKQAPMGVLKQETPREVTPKPAVAMPQQKIVQAGIQKHEEKKTVPLGENVLFPAPRSSNEFIVENAGMLYAQWSGTVLMDKGTVEHWGKKVKEVELTTTTGKKAKCKVQPIADAGVGTVQVPAKLQANLGIAKGARVKIRAIIK